MLMEALMADQPVPAPCPQHASGAHIWHNGKRLIVEGTCQYEQPAYSCLCGEQAPAALVPALQAAEREAARVRGLHFGSEPGEQGALNLSDTLEGGTK